MPNLKSKAFVVGLKGNEALEKKISSPRQGNMERKSKLKKKIKIPLFPASQTTF